jgi:DNA-binding transcriptional ArsR family regulator
MSNQQADAIFEALGEPVRRRILELLHDGPTPVGQLASRLPVGRPAVSKHLRVLTNAGLIEHRSVGTRNLYALAPDGMAAARQWIVRTWDVVLASFATEVQALTKESPFPLQKTGPSSRSSIQDGRCSTIRHWHATNTTMAGSRSSIATASWRVQDRGTEIGDTWVALVHSPGSTRSDDQLVIRRSAVPRARRIPSTDARVSVDIMITSGPHWSVNHAVSSNEGVFYP